MRDAIASQLVCHNLSRFSLVILQQPLEDPWPPVNQLVTSNARKIFTGIQALGEMNSRSAVTTCLEKYIDHIAILVNRPPQVLLFPTYLYEYFINVKCVPESLMSAFQSFGILKAELIAPKTNRFIAYGNTALSQ